MRRRLVAGVLLLATVIVAGWPWPAPVRNDAAVPSMRSPARFINVVSGVAFASLLPFIGIMFTVPCWDLSARYARTVGLDIEPVTA